jgi:osmotically-inducible protein OsmY
MTQSCGSHKEGPYSNNSAAVRGLNLGVKASPGSAATNKGDAEALLEKVRAALNQDAALKGSDIKVALSAEGNVILSGRVTSLEQSNRAVEVAKNISGVSDIRNLLEVTGGNSQNAVGKNNNASKDAPR